MQAPDDPQLLDLMLDDSIKAPDEYRATNYWDVYDRAFLPDLRKNGLRDFRRRRDSPFATFGAIDPAPSFGRIDLFEIWFLDRFRIFNNRLTRKCPACLKLLSAVNAVLGRIFTVSTPYDVTLDDIRQLAFDRVKTMASATGARPLELFEASLLGNPEDTFNRNGKVYTMSMLYYYMRYMYCCRFIDFDSVGLVVELGSGMGKQVEITRSLHPDIRYFLFDIPPQLYVCEQYLKGVFPGSVVSYAETRTMETLPLPQKGKIFIFGTWKFPLLEECAIDLFWNTASFQEMEPEVVSNYLSFVNRRAQMVYLQEVMGGMEIAPKRGKHGVIKPTTLQDYEKALSNFERIDNSASRTPLHEFKGYRDTFWKRKKNG